MNNNNLKSSLSSALQDLGIQKGQTVFIQSALISFMESARELTPKELPRVIIDCLSDCVGAGGTIAMPSFTTACAREGMPFDLIHTPSDSGSLVEYLRSKPETARSLHPVNSVIAYGHLSGFLTENIGPSSYSWDSPFDRMASQDTVVLCMGLKESLSNSFSHYAETRAGMPYLYNKVLDYIPVSIDGVPINKKFYMTVRYLDYDIKPCRLKHDEVMKHSGLMSFAKWGGGSLHAIKLIDYLSLLKSQLYEDSFFLLAGPPDFRNGEPPADGPASKHLIKVDESTDLL